TMGMENKFRCNQPFILQAEHNVAEFRGDTDPSLLIYCMFKTTAEHRLCSLPLSPTLPHRLYSPAFSRPSEKRKQKLQLARQELSLTQLPHLDTSALLIEKML